MKPSDSVAETPSTSRRITSSASLKLPWKVPTSDELTGGKVGTSLPRFISHLNSAESALI